MVKKNNIINLNRFLQIIKRGGDIKYNLPKIFNKNKISLDIRNFLNKKIKTIE
jgi:hypothetical protein